MVEVEGIGLLSRQASRLRSLPEPAPFAKKCVVHFFPALNAPKVAFIAGRSLLFNSLKPYPLKK